MGLLSDLQIFDLCRGEKPMVTPIPNRDLVQINQQGSVKQMGYGIDSYGYDARLAKDIEIFTNVNNFEVFDPKAPKEQCRIKAGIITEKPHGNSDDTQSYIVLPPNGFMLGHTEEWFNIPSDVAVYVLGKSSYARAGIIVNPTVLKPGWSGQVVLEISNSTPVPVKIYVGEGIAHFMFLRGEQPCSLDYLARGGKYQGQRGVTPGRA